MIVRNRWNYYRRIFAAYLSPGKSQLTFWHEKPEINERIDSEHLGEYYMPFTSKADYSGQYDDTGIPLLDYRGKTGLQYNPIATAQYGLGNYNLFRKTGDTERRRKFLNASDWLVNRLEQNSSGHWVWNHTFDWEYRTPLKAPWYSGLAQGQGISLLTRAYSETGEGRYLDAANRAFDSILAPIDQGGVAYVDGRGNTWIEEYIVHPPTHILNGFIWASWGVYDLYLTTQDPRSKRVFDEAIDTLVTVLPDYDVGFWSLYEQSGTRMKMLASPFYHSLHIVQLRVLYILTGRPRFHEYAELWEDYRRNFAKRAAAFSYKAAFKLLYY